MSAAPSRHPMTPAAAPHVYAYMEGEPDEVRGLRATLELAPVGIAQFDAEGRFLFANSRLCGILGYSREELLGLTFHELTFSEDRQACDAANAQLAAGDVQSYQLEKRFIRRDGSAVWTRVTVSAVREVTGELAFFVGIAEDISEQMAFEEAHAAGQQRAERIIRESEARLRALVDASPLGIDIMDLDGNPVFYNPMCEELYGMTLEEGQSDGWTKAIHPDDRAHVVASWYEAAGARRPWAETYRLLHRDGTVVWVSSRAAPMHIEGEPAGFVGTLEDITSLKLAEQAVRDSEARLLRISESRELLLRREREARTRAERAARMRDDVLAVVAHDLRNPLHTLQLSAQAMAEPGMSDATRAHNAHITHRIVESMDRLIGELLDIGRIEAGSFPITKESVELLTVLDETMAVFQPQADECDIDLVREDVNDAGVVLCDRDQIMRVFGNLLANAIKFTPRQGTVCVRTQRIDDRIEVVVEDTGPGIPREDLEHVFDRFWQADRTKRFGTGLGLVIAKGIVESHGGTIEADSDVGRGSRFRFTIPVDQERPRS